MNVRSLALACILLALARVGDAASARESYAAALARETRVRAALTATPAPAATREARSIVAAYQDVARTYPSSGYAANALWQAGRLSTDLFLRLRDARDHAAATRLLRTLSATFPKSRLARQIPAETRRLGTLGALARAAIPAPTPAATPVLAAAPSTESPSPRALLKSLRRTVLGDTVRLVLEFDGEVSFRDERLDSPLRLTLDLPRTKTAPGMSDRTMRFDGDADVVRQVRITAQGTDATRLVIDAAGVSTYSIYPLYGPYRLVIDCIRGREPLAPVPLLASRSLNGVLAAWLPSRLPRQTAAIAEAVKPPVIPALASHRNLPDWTPVASDYTPRATALILDALRVTPPPRLARRTFRTTWARQLPSMSSQQMDLIAEVMAPQPVDVPPAAPVLAASVPPLAASAGPPEPGSRTESSEAVAASRARPPTNYSMARQLGLSVSRIVIDPGHGGHDPGAHGKSLDEASLVLDVALRLEQLLQTTPGTEVILTRRTDEFVALSERTAIANRENADLFLSIHANASSVLTARGVETYFLNFADTLTAAAVAARENAASGQSMAALPDLVKSIALNNKLDESRDFASEVQRSMVERLRGPNKTIRDLGVKQAPFAVLIGAAMPSVLAEISFVTNAQEERLLTTSTYRQHIAEALAEAVRSYQRSLSDAAGRQAAAN